MLSIPPPPIQCRLEGLRFNQGNFGGKATLIRGRGGRFVEVSGFQGQSSHSFRSVSTVSSEIVGDKMNTSHTKTIGSFTNNNFEDACRFVMKP